MGGRFGLTHAQQYVEGQLIQPLVGQVARAQPGAVKFSRFELIGGFLAIPVAEVGVAAIIGIDLGQQRLNLGIGIELRRLSL